MAHIAKKVYALDPDPIIFEALQRNYSLNSDLKDKLEIFRLAIGPRNEELALHTRTEYGRSASSLIERAKDHKSDAIVKTNTLNRFVDENKIKKNDFIKVDVERGEFELIPSIIDTLIKFDTPTIYISFHLNYLLEAIYLQKIKSKVLSNLLFRINMHLPTKLFHKEVIRQLKVNIQSLDIYKYIYEENGKSIEVGEIYKHSILSNPINLVFSNKKWVK